METDTFLHIICISVRFETVETAFLKLYQMFKHLPLIICSYNLFLHQMSLTISKKLLFSGVEPRPSQYVDTICN